MDWDISTTVVGERSKKMGLRRVEVPISFLTAICVAGKIESLSCVRGLPREAKFVRGWHDEQLNCFMMLFEWSGWSPVDEGAEIPVFEVEFQFRV